MTTTRRRRLHQRIGEQEEAGYEDQAWEIAAELAVHFERSRDYGRAVRYLGLAGKRVSERSAYREAIGHLAKALELLQTLPDTLERNQQELVLQVELGAPLRTMKGYTAPEVEDVYTRAHKLCQYLGEPPQLFSVLFGTAVPHPGP